MRGFTTICDLGGPSFALKQAIDEGLVPGPRIYPCGAMITTTGGHGDMRPLSDLPRSPGGPVSSMERTGAANIADSADEVRLRVREQLLEGASQIKLVGGGGVSSPRTTAGHADFQRARASRRRRGRRRSQHLRRRARIPACRHSARDRRGRSVHRTRASDGRGDRQADGGQGRLAEHSAVRRRRRHGSAQRSKPHQPASGHCRLEHGLSLGESLQAQDRLRLGSLVFRRRRPCVRASC